MKRLKIKLIVLSMLAFIVSCKETKNTSSDINENKIAEVESELAKILKTINVTTKSDCNEKDGYWYKDKCWANFEDEGILNKDIDSVVTAQLKEIESLDIKINGKSQPLTFFFPEEDEDQFILITMFSENNETKTLLQFVESDNLFSKKEVKSSAILFTGNIMELSDQNVDIGNLIENPEAEGQFNLKINDFLRMDIGFEGELTYKKTKEKNRIEYSVSMALLGKGNSHVEVKGSEAYINGELGTVTYPQIKNIIENHPEVQTLVLGKINGSVNDAVNMHTGRIIREAGLTTKILTDSDIASGGVDLFCAGKERIVSKGAKVGVHSWGGSGFTAIDLPKDHPAHQYQIEYFTMCLGEEKGPDFYFYTLEASPFSEVHWMSDEEIKNWTVATDFIEDK